MIYLLIPFAAATGYILGIRHGWHAGFAKAESLVRLRLGWLMDGDATHKGRAGR